MKEPVLYGPAHPDEGLAVVGERVHVLASREQTGAGEAFIQEGAPGMGPPPHTHAWDEAYYMLEGEMDVLLGQRLVVLKPGMFVYIPAMTPHFFRYRTPGKFFSFTSGGGAARFFADLHHNASGLPPDFGKVVEVAARNGVALAAPPPA